MGEGKKETWSRREVTQEEEVRRNEELEKDIGVLGTENTVSDYIRHDVNYIIGIQIISTSDPDSRDWAIFV